MNKLFTSEKDLQHCFRTLLNSCILLIFCVVTTSCSVLHPVPGTFVDLKKIVPGIEIDLRYYDNHNFLGRPVDGYKRNVAYATLEAGLALQALQKDLQKEGLGIKVFDAYRPQQAVDHFKRWANDIKDTLAKANFYPDVDKGDLFKLGYIAERSGHSRGSTIDLTLITLKDKKELDMGSPFDYFGEKSHHNYPHLTKTQKANRRKLKSFMEKHGFKALEEEWWHYTLKNEPFQDKYFNFPVK